MEGRKRRPCFLKQVVSLIAPPNFPHKIVEAMNALKHRSMENSKQEKGKKNNHRSPLKPQVRPSIQPAIFDSVMAMEGHAMPWHMTHNGERGLRSEVS